MQLVAALVVALAAAAAAAATPPETAARIRKLAGEAHALGPTDPAAAAAKVEAAVALAPDDPEVVFGCASVLAALGRYARASDLYQHAAHLHRAASDGTNEGVVMTHLARTLEEVNNATSDALAATAYRSAVALLPDKAMPRYGLAYILAESSKDAVGAEAVGRLREAEALYAAATALKDDYADAWMGLGVVRKRLASRPGLGLPAGERHQAAVGAVEAHRKAAALEPAVPGHLVNVAAVLHERLDDTAGAVKALEAALKAAEKQDPTHGAHGKLRHMLAIYSGKPADRAHPEYVAEEFDAFAKTFESTLTAELLYDSHDYLRRALDANDVAVGDVLDLGCGTGLAGQALRNATAGAVWGVDLSQGMLDMAEKDRPGVYQKLIRGDVVPEMERLAADPRGQRFDLVVATDTFIYFGDLDAAFAAAKAVLRPGGHLALTTERLPGPDEPEPATAEDTKRGWRLHFRGTYAHAASHVARAAAAAGLTEVLVDNAHSPRRERGVDLPGMCVILKRR